MFVLIAAVCVWDCSEIKQWDGKNPTDPKVEKRKTLKLSGRLQENDPIVLFGGLFVLNLAA